MGHRLGGLGVREPGVELADGGCAVEVWEGELGEGELVGLAGGFVACGSDCDIVSVLVLNGMSIEYEKSR